MFSLARMYGCSHIGRPTLLACYLAVGSDTGKVSHFLPTSCKNLGVQSPDIHFKPYILPTHPSQEEELGIGV